MRIPVGFVRLEFWPAPEDHPAEGKYFGPIHSSVKALETSYEALFDQGGLEEKRRAPRLGENKRPDDSQAAHAPEVVELALTIGTGSLAAALYKLLRAWIDLRNGRRIKVKIGSLEIETTQLNPDDFERLLQTIKKAHDAIDHTNVKRAPDLLRSEMAQEGFQLKDTEEEELRLLEEADLATRKTPR